MDETQAPSLAPPTSDAEPEAPDLQEKIRRAYAGRQLRRWNEEAEALRETYPSLDLGAESQDRLFRYLLSQDYSVRDAYETVHARELRDAAVQEAVRQAVEGIRARGARPPENGTAAQSGFTLGRDPARLSKQERRAIVRRMLDGDPEPFRGRKE